jgi:SAM-dependent methyltransferase
VNDTRLQEVLEVNKKQKEFYNVKKKNFATKLWSFMRNKLLSDFRKELNINEQVYEKHRAWLGDLSDKKVLDLGCYAGNHLSVYLKHLPNAKAEAVDFLSPEFEETDFDVIYAYGVLHHFESLDLLFGKLKEKLADDGKLISYDPLKTSLPLRIIRGIYRPFQSDADWEWPFTKKTVQRFHKEFKVVERRAILGSSKWAFFLNLIPMSASKKLNYIKKLHQKDWEQSQVNDRHLYKCMHLTMLMEQN